MASHSSIKRLKTVIVYFFILFLTITIIFFAINLLIEPQIQKNFAVASQISKNYGTRYGEYLWNLITFSSGKIFSSELASNNQSIFVLYFSQFKYTIIFTVFIFLISLIIGNILGVWSAYKYNKAIDFIVNFTISFIVAIPLIIVAIIALTNASIFGYPSQYIFDKKFSLVSLLIPTLITSFATISLFHARSRKVTKEILISNYYLFSKTLGLSKTKLFNKNIFKNLLISQLQVILPFYILLFSTSLIIERVFSIPGQSIFLSYAFSKGEINLIMFYFTFSFFGLLVARIVNDLILSKLNPLLELNKRLKNTKRRLLKYE